MRFLTLSYVRASLFSPSRLALMLSLPVMLLFLVASAVFATPIMPPVLSSADLPATAGVFQPVVLHLSAHADVKVIRRALVDLSKKGLVRHIAGDASALYLEATPDALPELKEIEGVADVAFESRASTRGAQAPSFLRQDKPEAQSAEFKTYWLTMPEPSFLPSQAQDKPVTKAWSYVHNSLARWQADGHVSDVERIDQKKMRVVIKADAASLLEGLPDTVEVTEISPATSLSSDNGSPRMSDAAPQGQVTSRPYWLLLKPTGIKGGVSAALLRELGNLQAKGLLTQFERSVQDNALRVIALSTAEEELHHLPTVLDVAKSPPSASSGRRAANGGGQISGTVNAPDGTPLAEVAVMVERYNPPDGYWEWINDTLTGADGQYNVSGLQTGSYRVCFFNWTGPYLEECYNDVPYWEWDSATDISVTEGETTAGIDATLNEGGHMTGTVTDVNGNPLPDIEVVAFNDELRGESYAYTDENGHYDVAGLQTGNHRVCFYNWEGPYLEECYDNMPNWESATLVPVTVEETTTGIDAVLSEGGHITGTVTDLAGNPVSDLEVVAHWYNPEWNEWWRSYYGQTNENGQYDVAGLQTGTYRVGFFDWQGRYVEEYYDNAPNLDSATDIAVTAEQTTASIDAVLSEGGHITGSVTDSNGNPISGVEVAAHWYTPWGYWEWQRSGVTDANGQYDVAGLQTGTYRVCFFNWDGSYLDECYNDAPYVEEATDIAVIVEETIEGIDAVLSEGGHITGTVTDSDGNLISAVEVQAYRYNSNSDYWEWSNSGYTDANGQYDVAGLQTGSYRVCFYNWSGTYLDECYHDALYVENATDIAVTAEETTAGIDAVLSEGGHITGTVTDSDGNPISGVEVIAHWYNPEWDEWWNSYYGYTDANGQYDVTRLQTGTYRVGFFDWEGRYVEEYYDDVPTLESATDVAVTVEQTTAGIDALLSEGGHITGTVTDPDGNPVSGVEVIAHWYNPEWNEWWWSYYGYTDANGQYDVAGLQTGTYRVGFFDWQGRYVEEYYDDAPTLESATDVAVTVEQTTAGIDALLSEGGHITGTVSAPDGNPLPDVNVEVYRYQAQWDYWDYAGYAYTDETGQYDVAALQTGSYRVGFLTWEGQYLSEYYDNASTLESATDVAVIIEQTTSGIDALLDEGGHITGTVTDPDGNPLQEVNVEVYHYSEQHNYWEWAGYSYSDSNGQYDVARLHSGSYRVGFFDWQERYLSEYYLDAPDIESATEVLVTAGETTANIDASLNNGGHMTGTVTDSDGNPLTDIGIEVYRYNSGGQYWEWAGYGYTDPSGQYNAGNLHTGNYRVGFFAWEGQYLSEYYDNAPTLESGTDIEVIAEQTTADAVLSEGGHIRGIVTDAEGAPLYGIDVEAYRYNSQTQSWEWGGYGYTNQNGQYDVPGLHTGTYRVGFMDWSENYAREYYHNATDLENATNVAVTVSETTFGIDAGLQMGGRLEGSVTTSDGTLAREIAIEVYRLTPNAQWELVGWGYTGMGGSYVIGGLRSGTYRLGFFDWTGNYFTKYYPDATELNSATDIAVVAGETISSLDVTLEEGGHITGQITGEAAALRGSGENGLQDIQVEAYRYNGSHWEAVGFGYSDWNGNYDIAGLASGVYRVGFFEPFGIYAYQYYDDASNLANASEVIVIAGETTANINASLGDAAEAIAHATSASGSFIVDPQTGQITIIQPSWNLSHITITLLATCSDGSTPSDVTLLVGENSYPMSATGNENEYSATIPAADIEDGAQISLSQLCNGNPQAEEQAIGQIQILQDPSGYITDAESGEAVADARVTLYNVPSWRARSSATEENERTPNTCQSNLSKAADEPWSQEAPTELGVLATADESEIDPAINPIMTGPDGFYGWNVANGCWYIVVEADGYQRLVSPVVGVPPEVTDLNLALIPSDSSSVSFSETNIEVAESIQSAVISITLATVPTQTVSVDYSTLNDTATAGSDYTTARGTLTFLPSETIKSISITILDDERHEANETLRILLSNPINASLGVRNQVRLTIIDNEPPLDHHIYLPLMNRSSD